MRKRIITLFVTIVLCVLVTSCGISSVFEMDYDLYGTVNLIKEGEESILIYQGTRYYCVEPSVFNLEAQGTHNNDVMIDWNSNVFSKVLTEMEFDLDILKRYQSSIIF